MLITEIQVILLALGYYLGTNGPDGNGVDGWLGKLTIKAVKDFQRRHNLLADGKPGPLTQAALRKYLANPDAKIIGPNGKPKLPPKPQSGALRKVDTLIVHCTASAFGVDLTVAQIRAMHKALGWSDIGYHFVVRLDGSVNVGRPENIVGAHVSGHNTGSIGISYVGGLAKGGKAADTRTDIQKQGLLAILTELCTRYPIKRIAGHRDYSPDKNNNGSVEPNEWIKQCPCFDAIPEYKHLTKGK